MSLVLAWLGSIGISDDMRGSPGACHCQELRPVVSDEGPVFGSPRCVWFFALDSEASFEPKTRGKNQVKGRNIMTIGRRSTGTQAQMMPQFASITDHIVAGMAAQVKSTVLDDEARVVVRMMLVIHTNVPKRNTPIRPNLSKRGKRRWYICRVGSAKMTKSLTMFIVA